MDKNACSVCERTFDNDPKSGRQREVRIETTPLRLGFGTHGDAYVCVACWSMVGYDVVEALRFCRDSKMVVEDML